MGGCRAGGKSYCNPNSSWCNRSGHRHTQEPPGICKADFLEVVRRDANLTIVATKLGRWMDEKAEKVKVRHKYCWQGEARGKAQDTSRVASTHDIFGITSEDDNKAK